MFGVIVDLGEDLISCLCLGVKSRALVLNTMAKNLDALNVWWLGVFIAPTPKPLGSDRWSSDFWARLDVRWRTGHVL